MINKIIELRKQNLNSFEISNKLNISKQAVDLILLDFYFKNVRKHKVNDVKVKEVTPDDSNGLPLVLLSSEIRLRCSRNDTKINNYEIKTIYELNDVNSFCSLDIIKTMISEMDGPTLKNKYNSFLKMK